MRNLTMMTDLYELTMMNGYLRFGMENNRACFDIFYRKQGDMTAYAVAAGLERETAARLPPMPSLDSRCRASSSATTSVKWGG